MEVTMELGLIQSPSAEGGPAPGRVEGDSDSDAAEPLLDHVNDGVAPARGREHEVVSGETRCAPVDDRTSRIAADPAEIPYRRPELLGMVDRPAMQAGVVGRAGEAAVPAPAGVLREGRQPGFRDAGRRRPPQSLIHAH